MPFIPHTEEDIKQMLAEIDVADIETLFDEIPQSLKHAPLDEVPSGVSEMELNIEMKRRAMADSGMLSFAGAGAYEHHIPAAVWDLASRGEFYTAYTPYQAEASQGSLQLIYEYQSMMTSLMALDVSNASLYDGATALAESVLMAVRLSKKKGQASVLLPKNLHPFYRETVRTIVAQQNINMIEIPYEEETGKTALASLDAAMTDDAVALVIPQPNFFGVLEDVDALADWAKKHGLLSIAVVNPVAMALLKPPGQWGEHGADIACGEGQPLGIPLSSGGPYYGFMCCKKGLVRQLPGRIVGRTEDKNGHEGFVLTLQAREQHIRRAKATSNICTNQGLMVTASTIYMSLLGPEGLRRVALASHAKTRQLAQSLQSIPGVKQVFSSPYFHEVALSFDKPVVLVHEELARQGIHAGVVLREIDASLPECLLLCATETKTNEDISRLVKTIESVCCNQAIA